MFRSINLTTVDLFDSNIEEFINLGFFVSQESIEIFSEPLNYLN